MSGVDPIVPIDATYVNVSNRQIITIPNEQIRDANYNTELQTLLAGGGCKDEKPLTVFDVKAPPEPRLSNNININGRSSKNFSELGESKTANVNLQVEKTCKKLTLNTGASTSYFNSSGVSINNAQANIQGKGLNFIHGLSNLKKICPSYCIFTVKPNLF